MRFEELTLAERNLILNALLACPQLQTSAGRDLLIENLPPNVRHGLMRAPDDRSDAEALFRRCSLYPGGTLYLLQALAAEGRTRPFQTLLKTLNTHLPPGPHTSWNSLLELVVRLEAALSSGPDLLPRS